jgi:hypothetical protein
MKETIAQFLKVKTFPFTIKDENGNIIYWEDSNGYWSKHEYNSNGKEIYYENSNGSWMKREFDLNKKEIYWETSCGVWIKREFDLNGNRIYYEDSNGIFEDNRPKVEITLEEIAKLKGVDVSQIRIKE